MVVGSVVALEEQLVILLAMLSVAVLGSMSMVMQDSLLGVA